MEECIQLLYSMYTGVIARHSIYAVVREMLEKGAAEAFTTAGNYYM